MIGVETLYIALREQTCNALMHTNRSGCLFIRRDHHRLFTITMVSESFANRPTERERERENRSDFEKDL